MPEVLSVTPWYSEKSCVSAAEIMKSGVKEGSAGEGAADPFEQFKIDKEVISMPKGDGTGPLGQGPRTGKGQGKCGSKRRKQQNDTRSGRGQGSGQGAGNGKDKK